MSAVRDALKSIRATVLESCGDEDITAQQALLDISLVSLRQLELQCRTDNADAEASTECAEAAKRARKELKRFRSEVAATQNLTDTATVGQKRTRRGDAQAEGGASTSASASPKQSESSGLHLGQYASTDAFDGNELKKNKFARLLGGGKATTVAQAHNTVAASSLTVKEMNRVLESQFEDAVRRGKKKGLGA